MGSSERNTGCMQHMQETSSEDEDGKSALCARLAGFAIKEKALGLQGGGEVQVQEDNPASISLDLARTRHRNQRCCERRFDPGIGRRKKKRKEKVGQLTIPVKVHPGTRRCTPTLFLSLRSQLRCSASVLTAALLAL